MYSELGFCTSSWFCKNVAHGIHIGSCMDRFHVGSCCKILSAGELERRKSYDCSTIENTQTENRSNTKPVKDSFQVESFSEVAATKIRPTEEDKEISFPVKANFSSNSNVHINEDKTFTVSETYTETSSSSPNIEPVLQNTLTTISSSDSTDFLNYEHLFIEPDISHTGDFSTPSLTIKDVHSTPANVPQIDSSKSTSAEDTVQMYNYENPQNPSEALTLKLSAENELKNQSTVISKAHSHISFVLKDTTKDLHQSKQNSDQVNLPSNPFHLFFYNLLSKNKNEKINENKLFTTTEYSSILPSTDKPPYFNPSHPFFSTSQHEISTLPYSSVDKSDFITEATTVNPLPSLEEPMNINYFINATKFMESLYPRTTQSSANVNPVINKPVDYHVTKICGRPQKRIMPRIVGGTKSTVLKWPWMISLRQFQNGRYWHKCGATLLNEFWALTAAHCVDGKPANEFILRLGDINSRRKDELYRDLSIHIILIHPDFDPSSYHSDLALLHFYEPVRFQANIVPVCLPRPNEKLEGKIATVTGWGRLSAGGKLPSALQEVHVPIITNKECQEMYYRSRIYEKIRDDFVCAGFVEGGFDACEGDSGGPMVVRNNEGRYILVGTTSWGFGCAEASQPGIYTRITKFVDWIEDIISY